MAQRSPHSHKPVTSAYWLWGIHPVELALANPRRQVRRVVTTRTSLPKLSPHLAARHPKPDILEPPQFEKLLPTGVVHQGVALLVEPLKEATLEEALATGRPLILLDQVTDPHNVGAMLRSAAAFDAAVVVTTRHHAPEENGVIAKSSAGGIELVPLLTVGNLAQAMTIIKKAGYWCVGLDGAAKQTMAEAKLGPKTALVMGAEGSGLRRLTAETCDLLVRLPISDKMESLNVSNACAIALYEISRK